MVTPHHPVTATNLLKPAKERPESPKAEKLPLTMKKPDAKVGPAPKKFPAQIESKNMTSPKNAKEDANTLKSPEVKTAKNVSSHLSKEDLRTTFTPTTFAPKVFDPKEGLRKTTLAPGRQHEVKAKEV